MAAESTHPAGPGVLAGGDLRDLEVPSATRIAAMLAEIAKIGRDGDGGVTRLSFTRAERDAHAVFARWLNDLGLETRVDAIGNTIGELAGSEPDLPGLGIGSHLDSVPNGGRFDGIVGVVAAVEVARVLTSSGVRLRRPLRIVAFAGEEGARFGQPCIGSRAVVGLLNPADTARMRDVNGVTLAAAMDGVGLDPNSIPAAQWQRQDWAAFLELHIEQARRLENDDYPIGLVDVVSGSTRLLIHVAGRPDHSGGTPMSMRVDALVVAAEIVLASEAITHEPRNRGARLTVGRLTVSPNSITTIPGSVTLTIDIRDVDSDRQRGLARTMLQWVEDIAGQRGATITSSVIADTSPAVLPSWIRKVTAEECEFQSLPYKVMSSGAGHDAQLVNRFVPTGIVFVPSRLGLSHVPEEWTRPAQIAIGTRVILGTTLRLDRMISQFETVRPDDQGDHERERESKPESTRQDPARVGAVHG